VRFVRCEPDPDPLAIHTFVEAGEEIAYGDPSVTDAQRAAAGRETLGERSRAPLKANRRRAAQHAASTLPDDQQLVRVWQPRDPEALRVRLGNTPLAAWAEDDILHVLWRGQADEVHLAAGIQPQLWPVQGAKDLWEASVRIRRLAEAVITIAVLPRRADDDQGSQISDKLVRRGPQAPVLLPTAASLAGAITEHVLDSAALGAPRAVTVYHPPGQPTPLLGCVLADGGAARSFAGTQRGRGGRGQEPATGPLLHDVGPPGRPGRRALPHPLRGLAR
jgi:hypothetical protein